MKKRIIMGVLFVTAIVAGLIYIGQVSAKKGDSGQRTADDPRPETTTPQTLPFSQNWTNVGLITVDDNWTGVPGITGYRGDDAATTTADIDPRTITQDLTSSPIDINANRSDPDAFSTGGIAEFDGITNPVVAMQGSGTSDCPNIVIYLSTTGNTNIQVGFNARDIDAGSDVVQQLNVQYRVGSSGTYTNVTGGYFADVSAAGAALVTPVSVTLPAAANNQPIVEVRIMTTNATGSDEFIGIDDISVTGTGGGTPATLPKLFKATLKGSNEVPSVATAATGFGRVILNAAETQITASFYYNNLSSNTTIGHIHGPAAVGVNAGIIFDMTPTAGQTSGAAEDRVFAVTPAQVADLKAGLWYFNVHTANFPNGEIRGQILTADAPVDFNGDGKTDWVVARNTGGGANGQLTWFWNINGSAAATAASDWGLNLDTPVPADYDGDGKSDIAVWRPGAALTAAFYILQSQSNTLRIEQFGQTGDNPTVVADYNGDGKADVAVYRPGAPGVWYYRTVAGGAVTFTPWGTTGDFVAPGDYNGDGTADFGIVRSEGGSFRWWTRTSSGTTNNATLFGLSTDFVVTGDFDGDGKTDVATARPGGGVITWYWRPSSGGPDQQVAFGLTGDTFAPGDYDGDGKTDATVFRNGVFYSRSTTSGTVSFFPLGSTGDRIPAAYYVH